MTIQVFCQLTLLITKFLLFYYNVEKKRRIADFGKVANISFFTFKNALICFGGFYASISFFQVVYIFAQVSRFEAIFRKSKNSTPDQYGVLGVFFTGMYVLCFGGFFDELAAFFKY